MKKKRKKRKKLFKGLMRRARKPAFQAYNRATDQKMVAPSSISEVRNSSFFLLIDY